MKKILILLLISSFLISCKTSSATCDAYGKTSVTKKH